LIPKRWFAYSTVVVLLMGAIALFNGLAIYSPLLRSYVGDAGVAAFSLQGSGTLASWFASVLLAFSAAFCVQVYYLRRHKCDDYRGSYRLWLWAFALFAVLSVSATVGLGHIVQNVVATTAGALPSIGPVSILVVVACVTLTAMAMLATWETRVSRGAISLIVFSWLAGLVSILSVEPVVHNRLAEMNLIAVASNAWLAFCSCAFLAVLTYARYVYLAANGMLTVRQVESKPVKKQVEKQASQVAAKPAVKRSAQKRPATAAKPAAAKPAAAKPAAAKPATAMKQPKSAAAKPTAAKPVAAKPKPAVAAKPTPAKSKPAALLKRAGGVKAAEATNRMSELGKKAAERRAVAQSKQVPVPPSAADASQGETPKLSKADRRRKRKLELRQKRAA